MKTETEVLIEKPELAVRALRDSEQRYDRLLASTGDYVYSVIVKEGRSGVTSHGPGCEAVTGYSIHDFEAHPQLWFHVIHEDDRMAVLVQVGRVLKGEAAPPLEHRIIHKDGGIRWIRNTSIPHKDEQGRVVSYDGLISDITDQKRAEQLLAVQYAVTGELAQSRTLREAIPRILKTTCETFLWDLAAFWGVDASGEVLRCEAAWHRASARLENFDCAAGALRFPPGAGLPGRVWAEGEPIWILDIAGEGNSPRTHLAGEAGLHSACAFPLNRGTRTVGVIELFSRQIQQPDPHMLEVLTAVGTQVSQFVARKRIDLSTV